MIYWGIEKYNIHQAYQYAKSTHDREVALIEKRLKNLSIDDIIQIKEKNNYSSVKTYLKVEEIGPEDVIVSLIQKESDYSNSLLPIEQFYINNKNNFSQFPITFADLIKAYTLDYEQSIKEDRNGVDFLKDGKKYEIVRIERLYAPSISNQYSIFSDNENIRLSFKNYGWSGKVISIKSIEGNIKWNNKLPINVLSVKDIYEDSFSLIGKSDSKNTSYKIKMIILDSLSRKQTYLVEGGRNSHTVYQLE